MTIEAIDTEQLASRATSTSVTLLLLPRAIAPSSRCPAPLARRLTKAPAQRRSPETGM
ncbi:TraH protein [Actinomyces sp. Chiba101]|nr:TraH protein [Actinomyces sp. Chiba101]GAV94299.1 TraH protein [Actinomyces denticolens]